MRKKTIFLLIAVILFCSFFAVKQHTPAFATGPEIALKHRFGVGAASNIALFDYQQLGGIGWYFDWDWRHQWIEEKPYDSNLVYFPLVGGYNPGVQTPTCEVLTNWVNTHREKYPQNTIFMIGNEIGWDDQRNPEQYARAYHAYYSCIKAIDNRFGVAIGGIPSPSWIYQNYDWWPLPWLPWRGMSSMPALDYVRFARQEYESIYGVPMPIDAFILHTYVFTGNMDDIEVFKQHVRDYRNFMKEIGARDKPLIIKEMGIPRSRVPISIVKEFMYKAFDYLQNAKDSNLGMPSDENRLVQRWAWFVLNDGEGEYEGYWDSTSLFDSDTKEIRELGIAFFKYLNPIPPKFELSYNWNLITWPDIPDIFYTASSALADIDNDCGAGTGIVIATKEKDWWENYVKNYGGTNFDLQNNQNYFINVSKDCSWRP